MSTTIVTFQSLGHWYYMKADWEDDASPVSFSEQIDPWVDIAAERGLVNPRVADFKRERLDAIESFVEIDEDDGEKEAWEVSDEKPESAATNLFLEALPPACARCGKPATTCARLFLHAIDFRKLRSPEHFWALLPDFLSFVGLDRLPKSLWPADPQWYFCDEHANANVLENVPARSVIRVLLATMIWRRRREARDRRWRSWAR